MNLGYRRRVACRPNAAPWLALCTLVVAAAASAQAPVQRWDYKMYPKDRASGQYLKDRFVTTTIEVEERGDGKAAFRMVSAGRGDPCTNRGELPATVERDDRTTTVTVTPPVAGCEPFRYVIRNDGSGGVRQSQRGERWVADGLDHGLTPAK